MASNLNFVSGQVVANNVIAPIGDQGSVCFYTNVPSDIIVDIAGYFSGEDGNQFVGSTPKRYIDTRSSLGPAPISPDPIGAIDTDGDGIDNNADTDDDGDGVDDTRDPAPLDSSLTPPTAVLTLDINEGPSPLRGLWSTHPAALQALAMTQSQATPGTLAMAAPLLKKQRHIFILRRAASRSP